MAKEMATGVPEFMEGPLVSWFSSCMEQSEIGGKLSYDALIDGVLIHKVFLKMDLHCENGEVVPTDGDAFLRARNLKKIISNIRQFFEEELNHVLIRLPDIQKLSREPHLHVQEAKLLLTLLLGCAVECPRKEHFIGEILKLEETTKAAIAACITQVLHVPGVMLSQEMLIQATADNNNLEEKSADSVTKALDIVRRVCRERDHYKVHLKNLLKAGIANKDTSIMLNQTTTMEITLDEDELEALSSSSTEILQSILDCSVRSDSVDTRRKDAELLEEARSKLRKQQEEIKEKSDFLQEARDEIQMYKTKIAKMQKENDRLVSEVRSAKNYRDELDAANEKAERADRLEQEIARYKEKLADLDFCKTRLNELRQDNELLIESKEMLTEQANSYKLKADRAVQLEQQIYQLKQQVDDLSQENVANREKYRELCEENRELEQLVKVTTKESSIFENDFICTELPDLESSISMDNSLSEQLSNSAQSKALKLELENRRLSCLLESIKENSIQESPSKTSASTQDAEKENERLIHMYECLLEQMQLLSKKHELLQEEYGKLQMNGCMNDRVASCKYSDLERKYQLATREKQRLKVLLDGVQRRSFDLERSVDENKLVKDVLNESLIRKKEQEIQRQSKLLMELECKLQKLSVDSSLTDSQKQLSIANSQLIAEKEILLKTKDKLSGDLDHLKALYDQLNIDYQQLLQDRNQTRTQLREAKLTLRRQTESVENLETALKALEEECALLKSSKTQVEHNELKEDFSRLFKANENLLQDYKRAMHELGKRRCQGPELQSKSERIIELEIQLGKLENRLDVLEEMNTTLDKDKRSLMQHISQLFKQNHQLITQSLEDREHYHEEERKNTDQVNNLRRQKEKLEEKIMEHYRRQEPASAKRKSSRSIVKSTFVKVRRAGSEFLNRSRRSWADLETTSPADERSFDFEYTRGHESDDPTERLACRDSTVSAYSAANYPRNRKSVDFLDNFEPDNFSFGDFQARSRKSLDFAELLSLHKNVEDEEDLDRTLHDSSNTEQILASMRDNDDDDDYSTFGKNKSVDLSFEKLNDMKDFDISDETYNNNLEIKELNVKNRQSVWLDVGCV